MSDLAKSIDRERVLEEIAELYDHRWEVEEWMRSPHRLLGNRSPYQCISDGDTEVVLAVIAQLRDGAFV